MAQLWPVWLGGEFVFRRGIRNPDMFKVLCCVCARRRRGAHKANTCTVSSMDGWMSATIKYASKICVWRKRSATHVMRLRCIAPCSPEGCMRIVICPQKNTFVLYVSLPFIQYILMCCYSRCISVFVRVFVLVLWVD